MVHGVVLEVEMISVDAGSLLPNLVLLVQSAVTECLRTLAGHIEEVLALGMMSDPPRMIRIHDRDGHRVVVDGFGSPDRKVSLTSPNVRIQSTCEGEALEATRSCCNVLSTAVCLRKFCRGFEGPQRASVMMMTCCIYDYVWSRLWSC